MNVTILLADECSAASATMALEVFHAANLFAGQPLFTLNMVSVDGEEVVTSAGQRLQVCGAMDGVDRTDLVIIPGFLFTLQSAMPLFGHYRAWLQKQHRQGAVIASMCNAAFLLAESGLLDGRKATTHWAFADLFRRSFPSVQLHERQMLCDEHDVITAGGASAAMDLLLHLVRRFASLELAQTCSRYLLIDGIRSGQTPYVQWSMPRNHNDRDILRVQEWLDQHYAEAVLIDELAQRFGFGVRNFKRRFKEATGQTPLAYLQALRLEKAKYLMESSRMTLESITLAVGYEDSNSFRRLFLTRVGLTPAEYRRKFQSNSCAVTYQGKKPANKSI
jgi:transcriptional regulator GlxA family with amidase domain